MATHNKIRTTYLKEWKHLPRSTRNLVKAALKTGSAAVVTPLGHHVDCADGVVIVVSGLQQSSYAVAMLRKQMSVTVLNPESKE